MFLNIGAALYFVVQSERFLFTPHTSPLIAKIQRCNPFAKIYGYAPFSLHILSNKDAICFYKDIHYPFLCF